MNLLSGYRFFSKNRDYFLTHSAGSLPKRFKYCLGMFEDSEFESDVMVVFHNVETMIAEAQESVCILTNQILASTLPHLIQAMDRDVTVKLIMPKKYLPT